MFKQKLQLCADAVAAGDDDGLFVIRKIIARREKPECSEQLAGLLGAFDVSLDVPDE